MSPCGLRFKPDVLLSIHVSVPGSSPHFKNNEYISDGVYKRVIGTHSSAMMSRTLYFHTTGYWTISHAAPLGETSLA